MSELGTRLLNDVQQSWATKMLNDKKIQRLSRELENSADYEVANEFAVRTGELLSEALTENTNVAYMSEEVANEVLRPVLTDDHNLVAEAAKAVQANMNAANNIGLGVQVPALDKNRIDGIVKKVSSYATMDEAKWVLKEPIVNYSQSVVDQSVRDNATAQAKAGLKTYIVRKAEAHQTKSGVRRIHGKPYHFSYTVPCKWCAALEGTYEYMGNGSNIPKDVYRRHEACRCTLTFVKGNQRQNVWNHTETWTEEDAERQIDSVQAALNEFEGLGKTEWQNKVQMTLQGDVGFKSVDERWLRLGDKRVTEMTTTQLKRLEDKFNIVHRSVNPYIEYKPKYKGLAAVYRYNSNTARQYLTVNGQYYKSFDKIIETYKEGVSDGWWMPLDLNNEYEMITATVTHEYGHMIHNLLCQQYNMTNGTAISTYEYTEMAKNELISIATKNNPDFDLMKNISRYGRKNTCEFFAEVFCNSQFSMPNELGIAMQEWLKQKGF